jgi:hypothetical protein
MVFYAKHFVVIIGRNLNSGPYKAHWDKLNSKHYLKLKEQSKKNVMKEKWTLATCRYYTLFSSNIANTALSSSIFETFIIASGNNVYVTWTDGTPGNWEILLAKSADSGKTFNKPINVSDNAGESREPAIAILN